MKRLKNKKEIWNRFRNIIILQSQGDTTAPWSLRQVRKEATASG